MDKINSSSRQNTSSRASHSKRPFIRLHISIRILLPIALAFLFATQVSAHATLLRSDPAPNSVLSVSPPSVTLWFDEDLDPQFSAVGLLDKNQNSVDLKIVRFSTDHKQMSVGVQVNLPPGAYTVSWRALSAVDGHLTKGVFAIFVGATSAGQPVALNPASAEAAVLPLPFEVLVRGLNLLAALALCGALALNLLMGDERAEMAALRAASARRLRGGVVLTLIVLFAGTIVAQLLQAAAASDKSLEEVLAQNIWLSTLISTRFGQAGLARIVLVDALLILFAVGGTADRWRVKWLFNARLLDIVYVVLAASILFSVSLSSHAASSNDPLKLSLVADWLHLLAIGLWTGGLFALALISGGWRVISDAPAQPEAQLDFRFSILDFGLAIKNQKSKIEDGHTSLLTLLRRFSNLAVVSVALFALTGLYSMWRQIGSAEALVETPYGLTLIVKHLFIVPLLLIGAINTLLLRPNLLNAVQTAATRWRVTQRLARAALPSPPDPVGGRGVGGEVLRYVRIEAALGALAILAAATLTALPPARTALPPPAPQPFTATRGISTPGGEVSVSLKVDPYRVGNQTVTVKVGDAQGRPLANVTRVNLRFTFLGTDFGTTTIETTPSGDGVYKAQGGYLSVVGAWKVETVIRRKDVEDDLRIAYRLNVIDPASSRAEELPNISSSLIFAILDLLAGIGLLVYSQRKKIAEGRWIAVGALALGVTLFIISTFFSPPVSASILINPISPDDASLAQGQAVYNQNCVVCHGPAGRGNGPLAATLNPRPADFVLHINLHSDEVLFNWISQGIPGTAMPAWENSLSETERWNLLNYIQALVERVTSATPTPAATRAPSTGSGGAPTSTSAIDAPALLARSDAAMNQLRSLTEAQVLRDDAGNSVTATFEYLAPDRLHFVVSSGLESVAINDVQYYKEAGKPLEQQTRVEPLRWPSFAYATIAQRVTLEGEEMIDGEMSAVIAFASAKGTLYRHWIGEKSGWLRKQQMDAPDHHMLSVFGKFNEALVIERPAP